LYSVGGVIFKHGRDEVMVADPARDETSPVKGQKSEDHRRSDTLCGAFDCLQPHGP